MGEIPGNGVEAPLVQGHGVPVIFGLFHGVCWILLALSFWHGVSVVLSDAAKRRGSRGHSHVIRFYHDKRQQLRNHRFLRSSYLVGAIIYVTALTYAQLILAPGQLTIGQVFGLLLAYFVVAVVCWSMAVALVPFFEGILLDYNSILSAVIFVLYALYCNYGGSMGVMHGVNHVERLVSYNIYWLLEDAPLSMFLPIQASITCMHLVSTMQSTPGMLLSVLQLGGTLALYLALGVLLPMFGHLVSHYSTKPSKLPPVLFRVVCVAANLLSVADLILRTHKVVEPLQRSARSGNVLAALLESVLEAPAHGGGGRYRYGLPQEVLLGIMSTLLGFVILGTFVLALAEEPPTAEDTPQSRLVKVLQKYPMMLTLLGFMRSLPTTKKYAMCGMLGVSVLQTVGICMLTFKLLFSPSGAVVNSAPFILLSIMLGVIIQVVGVLYIIMPGAPWQEGQATPFKPSNDTQTTLHQLDSTSTIANHNPQMQRGMGNVMDSKSINESRGTVSADGSDPTDFRARMEALANFKTFMTGLDQQPGVYSLDEFIRGAANAMRGVFPQVHHASFCLLNSSRTCVNMYTFLGEGSQKPPRINVTVAPGTLIFHVLNNCQPVFVSDIASFPGPYSDVQFMRFVLGLRSVACLPLVVANARILGVLRLGFEAPWQWVEHEKSLAKQLALVLSSGSHSLGSAQAMRSGEGVPGTQMGPPSTSGSSARHGMPGGVPYGQPQPRISGSGSQIAASPYNGITPELLAAANGDAQMAARLRAGQQAMLMQQQQAGMVPVGGLPGSQMGQAGAAYMRAPSGGMYVTGAGPNNNSNHMMHPSIGSPSSPLGSVGMPLARTNSNALQRIATSRLPGRVGSGFMDPSTGLFHSGAQGSGAIVDPFDDDGASIASGSARLQNAYPPPAAGISHARSSVTGGQAVVEGGGAPAPDLKMLEVIGRGGFGSVYKAFWRGKLVAVKVLEHGDEFVGCADNNGERQLDTSGRRAALLEGAMTSTISHPNVVQTYDYRVVHLNPQPTHSLTSTRVLQETHIIMEWCDRGSLQDAMEQGALLLDRSQRGSAEPVVDMQVLVMTLAEVSAAMEYLHAHRITHRDLKPKNVLLRTSNKDKRSFCAKVSDFGLSQVLPDGNRTQVSQKYSGTVTHMPPELIEDGKVYQQGDVYAFGIMMWEAYTGSTPYQNMAHPQIMVAVVTHNLRPKFPDSCPEWYKSLAYKCWRKDPKMRPSFQEVTAALTQMVDDKNWPPVGDVDASTGGEQRPPGSVR